MKHALPIAALALLASTAAMAQTTDSQSTAPASTDATPTVPASTDATPADPTATDAATPDASPPDAADTSATTGKPYEVMSVGEGKPSLDTPIGTLIADPAAKAVLDKDLPGMSSDSNLDKFKDKSLRQLQPLTGGQLTDDLLKKTGADLAAIGAPKPNK